MNVPIEMSWKESAPCERESCVEPQQSIKKALVAVLLVLLFSLHWVRAASSLAVGSAPGFIGATVAVPVTVSQPTNVVAAQFEVAFDPTRVTPGAVTLPPRLTNHVIASREIAPGVWRVLVYSPINAGIRSTNRSVVANLPFTLAPQERVGSGLLSPNNVVVAKSDGTAVTPLGRQSGSIEPIRKFVCGSEL